MTTYKEAGVDIEAGDKAVKKIKNIVKSTFSKNVMLDIGGFGGAFEFPKNDYEEPVLVSSSLNNEFNKALLFSVIALMLFSKLPKSNPVPNSSSNLF